MKLVFLALPSPLPDAVRLCLDLVFFLVRVLDWFLRYGALLQCGCCCVFLLKFCSSVRAIGPTLEKSRRWWSDSIELCCWAGMPEKSRISLWQWLWDWSKVYELSTLRIIYCEWQVYWFRFIKSWCCPWLFYWPTTAASWISDGSHCCKLYESGDRIYILEVCPTDFCPCPPAKQSSTKWWC